MRPSGTQVVRVVLLAVVGLGLLAQAGSVPVRSDVETAVAQAQDGGVRTLQLYDGGGSAGFQVRVGPRRDPGRRLVWSDQRGVLHEAPLSPSGAATFPERLSGAVDARQDLLATVQVAAPDDARPRVVAPGGMVRDRLGSAGGVAVVVLLVLLAVGPQPRRATKWGWTAYVLVLPLTAGALLLLLRDAPWSRAATAEPEPAPHATEPGVRTSGGRALLAAVVVSLVLGLLSAGLLASVPGLGAAYERPEPYVVVRDDGTRAPGTVEP